MTVEILVGDVFDKLRTLEAESVDCCVSSFPYWGLRDYGIDGQIGLEPTLGEHIEIVVAVCEEIKRVLKPEGTFWLNYGDCYAAKPNGKSAAAYKADGTDDRTFRDKPFSTVGPIHREKRIERGSRRWGGGNNHSPELKPKDLVMMPNRIAIALQDAGWWVRSEIIWHKPNPMPDSAKDRPSASHEKIFLLTKSPRYFYDAASVREPVTGGAHARSAQKMPDGWDTGPGAHGSIHRHGREKGRPGVTPKSAAAGSGIKANESFHEAVSDLVETRNLRNVWTIASEAFPGAHFATFPTKLIEPCINAGCPTGGLVLDPFGGAGTTGLVAERLGRNSILIEINPQYAALARRRLTDDAGMFADVI